MKLWVPAVAMLPFAALLIVALIRDRAPEPIYRGLPLSTWIERFRVEMQLREFGHQSSKQIEEARAAIAASGTNGLPFLAEWAAYEPLHPGSRYLSWAPLRFSHEIDMAFFNPAKINRAEAATEALEMLGTNASAAIPRLSRVVHETKTSPKARRIERTLTLLGPEALPTMLGVWSNAAPAEKQFVSVLMANYLIPTLNTRNQLVPLLPILESQDGPLRSAAYRVILSVAPDLLTNTPAINP